MINSLDLENAIPQAHSIFQLNTFEKNLDLNITSQFALIYLDNAMWQNLSNENLKAVVQTLTQNIHREKIDVKNSICAAHVSWCLGNCMDMS
jgi:hypothetical protein